MTKPPVFVLHFVLKTGGFGLIVSVKSNSVQKTPALRILSEPE